MLMDACSRTVRIAKFALGNPIFRAFIGFYVRKGQNGRIILDAVLEKYLSNNISGADKLRILPLSVFLKLACKVFGADEEAFREWFRVPTHRRGLVNTLRSIYEYGITLPQKLSAPFLVVWNYTNLCNLRCRHCYQRAGAAAEDELTTEERLAVVDQLAEECISFLAISGGEPLLREDVFKVAERASDCGIFVAIATNGTLLSKDMVRRLEEHGVRYVQISLDGAKPETHDSFRGVRGAWEKTVEGIKNCVDSDIMTTVAVTVTKHNYEEFDEVVRLVEELGADKLVVYNFIPTGRGEEIVESDLSPEMREELLQKMRRLLKRGYDVITTAPQFARVCIAGEEAMKVPMGHFGGGDFRDSRLRIVADFIGGCGAGREYCAIQPNGDVTPCVFMPIVVGNLRRQHFAEIWRSSEVLEKLRDRRNLKGGCASCDYKYVCGGCRSRAYAYFGDLNAPDPGCIYNARWWRQMYEGAFNKPAIFARL